MILRTEKVRAKIVASCVGGFVEPKAFPTDIPGRDSFEGEIIHTARWRPDVDLTGKDVVVIGTGCSAAQVIPQLIKPPYNVKSITQLMRSPPWVAPNILTPEGVKKWEEWMPYLFERIPGLNTVVRKLMFSVIEFDFFQVFTNTQFAERRRKVVEDTFMRYMKKTVPEKYHEILTPDYIVGLVRSPILSEDRFLTRGVGVSDASSMMDGSNRFVSQMLTLPRVLSPAYNQEVSHLAQDGIILVKTNQTAKLQTMR